MIVLDNSNPSFRIVTTGDQFVTASYDQYYLSLKDAQQTMVYETITTSSTDIQSIQYQDVRWVLEYNLLAQYNVSAFYFNLQLDR